MPISENFWEYDFGINDSKSEIHASSGKSFFSAAFLLALSPYEPSNGAFQWLSKAVFKMINLKIGGIIKNLRGKELKKQPVSLSHLQNFWKLFHLR